MNIPFVFLRALPTVAQMGHSKSMGFIRKSPFPWILKVGFMGLALFATVTTEHKVEAPPSGLFCISDCATCPVICSPPPPLLTSYSPPSPSVPHSPSPSSFTNSPPPPKSQAPPPPPTPSPPLPPPPPTPSSHSSGASPPPPLRPYNTPPSGSSQPQPTVISGPHDYSYPYYYFYASGASALSLHAPFFVLLLFLHRVFCCW